MDLLFQYIAPLLLFPLTFAALLLLHNRGSKNSTQNWPPGTSGWPIVGESLNYGLEGSRNFISDRMNKYSPQVFQTRLMGEKMAIFCGPQGNKFLFTKENKLLSSWFPLFMRKLMIFPEHYEHHREVSAQVRGVAIDIFKPESLKKCIPFMHSSAREHINKDWDTNEQVRVFPLSKKYIFDLACKLFLGIHDPNRISVLSDTFLHLLNGLYSVPIDFPGTTYHRAVKAGHTFRAELLRIVRERRKELRECEEAKEGDVLSKMLLQNEERFNEKETVHNIIVLLVGSYDTTSTAITFVLKHLAELPHIYDKVYQEVMSIAEAKGEDELLTWEDIEKMKYSWNVVRETMRVAPPSQGLFGEAVTDFTFAGFTIPKGWKTFWNVYTTHNDPNYFPEPEKIDPTRFEGSGPTPYTFVPFGGGPRMCPGREYARVVVLVFIYNIVTRFKLEKAVPNEKITYDPSPQPAQGLPLHLRAHSL